MFKEQLKELQKIFIEAGDWQEVSKLQHEIDNLPSEPVIKRFEPWFANLLMKKYLADMRSKLSHYILAMRYAEKQ